MWISDGRREACSRLVCVALLLIAASGCVEVALRERVPMEYEHVAPLEITEPSEGAIWPGSTSGGSYLYYDQKAHRVGDLVTVMIAEDMEAQGTASTELDSSSSQGASVSSSLGLEQFVVAPIRWLLRTLPGFSDPGEQGVDGSSVNVLTATKSSEFDGDGTTSRSGKFTGQMTCRVIAVLPGGVLHIRGRRHVVVNHDAQYITLEGLVRKEDISVSNTVSSIALAEARLTYDGLGVIDDKQRPGVMARALDWLYPL